MKLLAAVITFCAGAALICIQLFSAEPDSGNIKASGNYRSGWQPIPNTTLVEHCPANGLYGYNFGD